MLGELIATFAFIILLIVLFIAYHAAQKCHEGDGGVLCKLWSWIA